MSELQHALDLFEFTTIDDVTVKSLKKAFKTHIIRAHPDKGGDSELFDQMLRSYMYLTETVRRISGGRDALQNVTSVLMNLKKCDLTKDINRFFEEFINDEFNKYFEEVNVTDTHGYANWLKGNTNEVKTDNKNIEKECTIDTKDNQEYYNWLKGNTNEDNLTDGEFGNATQKPPTFDEKDFHKIFEQTAKEGKPEPTAIILHPEQMAYISGQCIGTDIIQTTEGGYTSQLFTNPKFTDVYEAFSNLTVCDKVPTYIETNKTIDELITERNKDITPFNDTELKAIQDYEKMKLEKNINNLSRVKEHFQYDEKYKTGLTNWPPEKYSKDDYKGFVVDF